MSDVLFPEPASGSALRFWHRAGRWLAQSTEPEAKLARSRLNRWFALWDPSDRADVRQRVIGSSEDQFRAAMFELYINALLRGHGYTVTRDPTIPGSTRTPDFLAERDDIRFYVEATSVGTSDADEKDQNRLHDLLDVLERAHHDDFMIGVNVDSFGAASPRANDLRGHVQKWLACLDLDQAIAAHQAGNPPITQWKQDDWSLTITAFPARRLTDSDIELIGALGPGPGDGLLTDKEDLRKRLDDKAKKYGDLDAPYVIAVLEHSFGVNDDWHRIGALFGSEHLSVPFDGPPESGRAPDGFWIGRRGPRNTHLSAVLLATNVFPSLDPLPLPELWINPDGAPPFDPEWLPLRTRYIAGNQLQLDDPGPKWTDP